MKRNGFTLIELLAVIIILAIVALIATPIIINIIDDVRKEGFKQTALGYYKAAEYVYDEMFLGGKTENIQFTFEGGNQTSSNENYKLEVRGETPKGGLVYLTKDGNIVVSISNNKYCAYVDENKEVTLSEDITSCGYTPVPDNCYTIDNRQIWNSYNTLDGSEEWMNANYNMLVYDDANESCPKNFDILILPSQVDGEKVDGISYVSADSIKHIIIPSGVKIIDEWSIGSWDGELYHVTLPDGLLYIGPSALANHQLTNLILPDGLKVIDIEAFAYNDLTHVEIPDSVNKIEGAFANNQLTSVIIPDGVTSIGHSAFANNQLTSVNIPTSVTSIGSNAFTNNQLTNVELPSNLTVIGGNAFQNNQLKNLIIPEGVTSIGRLAFANNQLTSVNIPSSVTSIGSAAFNNNQLPEDQAYIYARNSDGTEDKTTLVSYGGAKKENVEIPASVNIIENWALSGSQLISVKVPSNVTTIGGYAFAHNQLKNIMLSEGIRIIEEYAFVQNELTSIEIPNSVYTLGDYIIAHNPIKDVVIGNGVHTITEKTFGWVSSIDNLTIGKDAGGKGITIGSQSFMSKHIKTLTLGESVINMGKHAFSQNELTNVTLPDSVTDIGASAFESNKLTSISIPNSVTTIGNSAFRDNKLTSLNIPSSVTSIGNLAFNNNQLPDDQAFIYARNSDGTENRTKLISYGGSRRENVNIPIGTTEIDRYVFYDQQLTSVIISEGVTVIGESAFANNNLTSVNLPSTLQRMNTGIYTNSTGPFYNNKLTSITIPSNVQYIGNKTFANNSFPNRAAITIEGDATRFDSRWAAIGFPTE